ncbi:MAG: prepilin-type N-terminal cleavage/methylation domain-containing protein [Candidatus Muiribacteriota bacterium]
MNRKGFSLVEIMIVVAIIGILVAALLPQLGEMIDGARKSSAERSMHAIKDAIVRFNASEPRELQDLNWLVPRYLAEIKPDPWGTPYTFLPDDGVIISYGKDRQAELNFDTNPLAFMDPRNRDNIEVYYKPPLQITSAKMTLDKNGNRRFNNGDRFTIFFTKPASKGATGAGGAAVNFADFLFVDEYDIAASAVFLPADTTMINNFITSNPPYIRDLVGGAVAGNIAITVVDPSTGNTGNHTLEGDRIKDGAITFEITNANERYEIIRDIYVRFSDIVVTPGTGDKYRDRRGNVAVQNGYNVQIETY